MNNRAKLILAHIFFLAAVALTGGKSSAVNDEPLAKHPPGRIAVSILWFENRAGEDAEHWRYGLNGSLKKAIKQVDAIRLRGGTGYARRKLVIEKGSALTVEQARKIGEIVEAQRVVWGSYQGSSNSWQVTAFLLNVASGEVSEPITAVGTDWFDLRDAVTRQILEQLKIIPSEEEKEKMLRRETHSPQALEWRVKSYAYQIEGRPFSKQEEATRLAIAADAQYAEAYIDLGGELASQGKFDEAEICLRRAVEIEPDLAGAHRALGAIHLFKDQDKPALRELEEALRLDPENTLTLVRLSEVHAAKKQWEQALTYAEEAIVLAPLDASLHAHLGLIYVNRHERDRAMRELKEAERLLNPDASGELNTVQKIGQSYRMLGEIPLAAKHYDRFVTLAKADGLNPEWVAGFAETGEYLKSTLTPTDVDAEMPRTYTEQALQKVLKEILTPAELDLVVNPITGSPEISHWARRLTDGTTSETGKAKAIFDEMIQRIQLDGGYGTRTAREVFAVWDDPDQVFSCQEFAKLYLAMARAVSLQAFYVHLGRDYRGKLVFHDCAIVFVAGKALLVDPAYRWFGVPHQEFTVLDDVQTVAHQLFQHAPGGRSVARCRAAAKLHPDFAWGQMCLAAALVNDDKPEAAIKALEKAERLEPGRWDTHRLRAFMAVKDEDWNAAMGHVNKALDLNPEDAETLFLQGTALQALGKDEEAREAYRACLRNDPKDDAADNSRRAIVQINEKIGVASGAEFGTAALLVAIEEGKVETVRQMLAEGVDANTQEPSGATALMVAAHQGHLDIVKLLLDSGADVTLKDTVRDFTALMVAAQEGRLEIAALFLSAGADVNEAAGHGGTALHSASDSGHPRVVGFLLKKGADVNASDSMRVTPLLLASQNGHVATARVLIEAGADVEAAEKSTGGTPLFVASQNGHADIVKLLLANKAEVDAALKYNGHTPLLIAVVRNHADVVKLLLDAGADINAKGISPEGQEITPLVIARKLGHEEIVELLQ